MDSLLKEAIVSENVELVRQYLLINPDLIELFMELDLEIGVESNSEDLWSLADLCILCMKKSGIT